MLTKIHIFLRNKNFSRNVVYSAALIYFVLFSYLATAEHLGLKSSMNDLGNMDQAIYMSTRGEFMKNSTFALAEGQTKPSIFAKHAFFTLLFFVPLYYLQPNPLILIIFQVGMVAFGALPLFWLSKKILTKDNFSSMVVPLAYLLNPIVHDVTLHDFEPMVVVMSLIILAFYFMYTKRFKWFYLLALLISLSKEDLPLTMAMFGFYMFFVQKERIRGALVSMLAISYFIFVIKIVFPYFSGTESMVILTARYSHLGKDALEIAKSIILRPWYVLSYLFGDFVILASVLIILIPFLFLPLISLNVVILATPSYLVNMLSDSPQMHWPFHYHYFSTIMGIVFVATIFSLNKVRSLKMKIFPQESLAFTLLVTAIANSVIFSPAPFSLVSSWQEFNVSEHAREINEIKKMIPESASVSAQHNLGPHLSQRSKVYNYPYGSDFADYVFLDVNDPNPVIRMFPRKRNFTANVGMYPNDYRKAVEKVFDDDAFGVEYFSQDGYLVFKKGASRDKNGEAYEMFKSRIEKIFSALEPFVPGEWLLI